MRILHYSLIYSALLLGCAAASSSILAQDSQVVTEKSYALHEKLKNIFPYAKGVYVDEESGATVVELRKAELKEILANLVELNAYAALVTRYSGRMDVPADLATQIQAAGGRCAAFSAATDVKKGVIPIHVYDARPEDLRAMLDAAQNNSVRFTGHIIVVPERNTQS